MTVIRNHDRELAKSLLAINDCQSFGEGCMVVEKYFN